MRMARLGCLLLLSGLSFATQAKMVHKPVEWTQDGTRFHTTRLRIPGLEEFAPGYVQPPGGPMEQIEVCAADEVVDGNGFPVSATLTCGPLDLAIEPVAFSPVHLVDDDGSGPRHARFPRALCRFESGDGRRGVGWTEWNQPPVP